MAGHKKGKGEIMAGLKNGKGKIRTGHKKEKGEIRTRQKKRKARRAWPKKKVKDGKEGNKVKLEDERMMEIKVEKEKATKEKQSFVAFNICACFYKKLNLVRDSCLYRNMVAVAFYYSAARVKRL